MGLRIWPEFINFGQIIEVQAGSGQATHGMLLFQMDLSTQSTYFQFLVLFTFEWNKNKNTTGFYPIYGIPSLLILESALCTYYIESLPSSKEKKASVFPAVSRLYFLFLVI